MDSKYPSKLQLKNSQKKFCDQKIWLAVLQRKSRKEVHHIFETKDTFLPLTTCKPLHLIQEISLPKKKICFLFVCALCKPPNFPFAAFKIPTFFYLSYRWTPCWLHFLHSILSMLTISGVVSNEGQFPLATGEALTFMTSGPMSRFAVDIMPMFKIMSKPAKDKLKLEEPVSTTISTKYPPLQAATVICRTQCAARAAGSGAALWSPKTYRCHRRGGATQGTQEANKGWNCSTVLVNVMR